MELPSDGVLDHAISDDYRHVIIYLSEALRAITGNLQRASTHGRARPLSCDASADGPDEGGVVSLLASSAWDQGGITYYYYFLWLTKFFSEIDDFSKR
jgi:hypothetical protein